MDTVLGVCPVHGAVAMWGHESLVPFEEQVCTTRETVGDDLRICLLVLELHAAPATSSVRPDEFPSRPQRRSQRTPTPTRPR